MRPIGLEFRRTNLVIGSRSSVTRRGKKVTTLKGPWSEGVDAAKTEIDIHARLNPPNDKEKKEWDKRDDNHGDKPAAI